MKKVITSALVYFFVMASHILAQTESIVSDTSQLRAKGEMQAAEMLKKVKVPKGTIITLELNHSVRSEDVEVGKIISVSASLSVFVDGQEVILRGSPGEAKVKSVRKKGGFGRPGEIEIEAHNITLYDNTRIRLKGEPFKAVGRSRRGLAWGLTFSIPIPPFVFFIGSTVKGMSAEIKAGEQIHATTMQEIEMTSNPKSFIPNE
jgi:hypothetical protein